MWRPPRVAVLLALSLLATSAALAQTVIFSENFGTPSTTTSIGSYTGYQNFGALTFSGTGDVRTATPSANYSGASGGGNVFLTNNGVASFTIGGIDTPTFQAGSFNLSFGAFKSTIASTMSELSLAYSTDGTNYTALLLPTQSTGSGTASWRSITLTSLAIPNTATLSLRWTNTGSGSPNPQFRLDDISMSGTLAAVPEPSTYAAIAGVAMLGAALWRRARSGRRDAARSKITDPAP